MLLDDLEKHAGSISQRADPIAALSGVTHPTPDWKVIVEEFMSVRIKHRDKGSSSTQQTQISLVSTESVLLS